MTAVDAAEVDSCAAPTESVTLVLGDVSEPDCDDTSCKVVWVCCRLDAAVATADAAASIVPCVETSTEADWITSSDALASGSDPEVLGSLCSPPVL